MLISITRVGADKSKRSINHELSSHYLSLERKNKLDAAVNDTNNIQYIDNKLCEKQCNLFNK